MITITEVGVSEYSHVEKPFLDQLAALGWKVTDQGQGFIPTDPAKSLRTTFREWFLPEVFRDAVRSINLTPEGKPWLTDRQLDDLRDQILRQLNRTLLEANETTQELFLKAQVDHNEVTGETAPPCRAVTLSRATSLAEGHRGEANVTPLPRGQRPMTISSQPCLPA